MPHPDADQPVSVPLAYVALGDMATVRDQRSAYTSLQGGLMVHLLTLFRRAAVALLMLAAMVSTQAHADDSLYREFGGKAGLERIIDDFYDSLLEDPRTKSYFEGASIPRIEKKLNEQFCVLLGGTCVYTGRTMKRTHEGLNIDHAAFNAAIDDLRTAMKKNGVPVSAQNKLLAKLAPMSRDIQERE
ncbi:group I truncated hemoglobin [Paraburkholderia hospita]|nr:group 1 truncated hemoglobin [Paraburkholderia hospita]